MAKWLSKRAEELAIEASSGRLMGSIPQWPSTFGTWERFGWRGEIYSLILDRSGIFNTMIVVKHSPGGRSWQILGPAYCWQDVGELIGVKPIVQQFPRPGAT